MSKISKTAAASMRGGIGEVKKDPFDTNEKKIHELRLQRENKLSVNRYDFIDALFVEYDKAIAELVEVTADRNKVQQELDRQRRGLVALQNDLAAANTELEFIKGGPLV